MSAKKSKFFTLYKIVFIGIMSALVYVLTLLRFPFLGSQIHLGNSMCLLAGLLFGPVSGGLASGIGSIITDILTGYDIDEILITFASKFVMGFLAGLIGHTIRKHAKSKGMTITWLVVGSIVGSVSYVFLYMLKHFIKQLFIYANSMEGTLSVLATKFPASAINAVFAIVVAPILFLAIYPAISHLPMYKKTEE